MARSKPSNLQPVRSTEEANDALREIGELNRVLAEIENRMNDDIAAIKSAAAEDAATYRSRLEALENGVYAFAELKKNDLFDDKRRSVKLDFGIIGYRRSHEIGTVTGRTTTNPETRWTFCPAAPTCRSCASSSGRFGTAGPREPPSSSTWRARFWRLCR